MILNSLGATYYWLGNLTEAESAFRRALAARLKILGPDASTVATTSSALALVLTGQEKYAEAKSLYAESLRIHEHKVGLRTPEVAATLEQFARLLRKMKSDEEALTLESRAKSIRTELKYTVKATTQRRVN